MKMIIGYLKTLKYAMYTTDLPVSLQPVEKPLKQTLYYKSALESQYQLLEDRKHKAQRKHSEKVNCDKN